MSTHYCIQCGEPFESDDPNAVFCPKHVGKSVPENDEKQGEPIRQTRVPQDKASVAKNGMIAPWKVGDIILDTYEVKRKLGEGGFGAVYQAYHSGWKMDLAIKRALNLDEQGKSNFIHEAEKWIDLGLHPHIISCYYVRNIDGFPHTFAELAEGGSLHDWIQGEKGDLYTGEYRQIMTRLLDIAIQFAWGLGYAHQKGLIHGDVKPQNALMTPEGLLKVTDFGLARARKGEKEEHQSSAEQKNFYSPYHCSPEQRMGKPLTLATDIWSWAVSVLEMFNGGVSWMGGQVAAFALESYLGHSGQEDDIPHMPDGLVRILRECFRENPKERPEAIESVAEKIKEIFKYELGITYPRQKPDAVNLKADSLNNKAISLIDIGKFEQARHCWEEALSSDSHHLESNFNYGSILWHVGEHTDLDFANQLTSLQVTHGSNPLYWYLLAAVELERGELSIAKNAIETCEDHTLDPFDHMQDAIKTRMSIPESGKHQKLPWRRLSVEILPNGNEEGSAAAMTNDGKWCVSGSQGGVFDFWNLENRTLIWSKKLHRGQIVGVAIAPDASIGITAGEDQNLYVWDLKVHKRIFKYNASSRITALHVTPDFRYFLLGTINGPMTLWDISRFSIITSIEHGCSKSTISADAHYALTEADGNLWYWDLHKEQLLHSENLNRDRPQAISLSADGQYALYAINENDICVFDLINKTRIILSGHKQQINDLAFSYDQHYIVSVSGSGIKPNHDFRLRLWDLEKKCCLWSSPEVRKPIISLSLGRNAQHALTMTEDGSLHLWNLDPTIDSTQEIPSFFPFVLSRPKSGHILLNALQEAESLESQAASYESHGQWKKAYDLIRKSQELRSDPWKPELISTLARLGQHGRRVKLLGFHAECIMKADQAEFLSLAALFNRGRVICGDAQGKLWLWDFLNGKCLRTINTDGEQILHTATPKHEEEIFVVNRTKDVKYLIQRWGLASWDYSNLTVLDSAFDLNLSPDDRLLLISEANGVIVFDLKKQRNIQLLRSASIFGGFAGKRPISAKIIPQTQTVVTGSEDGRVTFWDLVSGKEQLNLQLHKKAVECIEISKDGLMGLSGSRDNQICLIDLIQKKVVHCFQLSHNVKDIRLSGDGHHAFSWGEDLVIDVWNLYELKHVSQLVGHQKAVTDFQISSDCHSALSCGMEGQVIFWKMDWDYQFPQI